MKVICDVVVLVRLVLLLSMELIIQIKTRMAGDLQNTSSINDNGGSLNLGP